MAMRSSLRTSRAASGVWVLGATQPLSMIFWKGSGPSHISKECANSGFDLLMSECREKRPVLTAEHASHRAGIDLCVDCSLSGRPIVRTT